MVERFKLWLKRLREAPCEHKWVILIEKYPTFTKDFWQCRVCYKAEAFNNDSPPVKIRQRLCDLGHLHIVNK